MNYQNAPNFFLIGAMKSATTSLHNTLKQHPQIYCSPVKETRFFSNNENYARGLEWYLNTYFRNSDSFPVRGESDPHYLYWGETVAPRMRDSFPENAPRFIAILREPVSRAYSHYWHQVRKGEESISFEQALLAEEERLSANWEKFRSAGLAKFGYFYGGCYFARL